MKKQLLFMLALLPLFAQAQVSNYTFTSDTSAYALLDNPEVLGSEVNDDEGFQANPIGFSFTYNGRIYTTFSVNTNGYIALGNAVSTGVDGVSLANGVDHSGRALSGTTATNSNNVVAGLNLDLMSKDTGSLTYQTLGTAPDRRLVIQWSGYQEYSRNDTLADDNINFQIELVEGSNAVIVRYGTVSFASTTLTPTAQVGLRGSAVTDFNARTSTGIWDDNTASASPEEGLPAASGFGPSEGLTFTWAPDTAAGLATDLHVNGILDPADNFCELAANQIIRVEVKNVGGAAIDSVAATYSVDDVEQGNQTFRFTSPLAVGDSAILSFTAPYTFLPGGHQVTATVDPFETDATADNTDTTFYYTRDPATAALAVPFTEGFNDVQFFPEGWSREVVDGPIVNNWVPWGANVRVGNVTTSGILPVTEGVGSVLFPSYYEASGSSARLRSPCFDMSAVTGTDSLVLEVSYMRTGDYLDSLDAITVETSTDGLTYTALRTLERPDASLAANTGAWNLARFDISAVRGQSKVRFGFLATSKFGDNMAIDYITIREGGSSTVMNRPALAQKVSVYPNPTAGGITLRNLPAGLVGTAAALTDMSGRVVSTRALAEQMDLGNLPAGFYYLTAPGLKLKVAVTK